MGGVPMGGQPMPPQQQQPQGGYAYYDPSKPPQWMFDFLGNIFGNNNK